MCKGGFACLDCQRTQKMGKTTSFNSMDSPSPISPEVLKQRRAMGFAGLAIVGVVAVTLVDLKRNRDKREADERPVNAPLPLRPSAATGPTTLAAPP
jgi:hypothetical protein